MSDVTATKNASKAIAYWLILAVVVADQLTKQWVLNALSDGKVVKLYWTLQFNLVFNSGMAFSQGQGVGRIIGVLAIFVVIGLLMSLRDAKIFATTFGIGLLVGGATGNILDRLFRDGGWMGGSVVDFIDLQWFPVFNVADSAVTIGAGFLILGAFMTRARS